LVNAGFVIDDVGSEAVLWDPEDVVAMYETFSGHAVAIGAISEEQRGALLADIDSGVASGDFHFSVTMFAVLAHRG